MMENWEKFMLESNGIEGEHRLNPGDEEAFTFATTRTIETISDIWALHKILGNHLDKDWVGKWRNCSVRVGRYYPPRHEDVPNLMKKYIKELRIMNAFEAHNEFELIHPFQDLNGRVGRLLWLNKLYYTFYDFSIPFLQTYYYQTLQSLQKRRG